MTFWNYSNSAASESRTAIGERRTQAGAWPWLLAPFDGEFRVHQTQPFNALVCFYISVMSADSRRVAFKHSVQKAVDSGPDPTKLQVRKAELYKASPWAPAPLATRAFS